MKALCIVGKAGAGKDSAADFLVQQGWVKVSFADEIKRIAMRLYGFTEQQLWGPSEMRNTVSPRYPHLNCREVLQKLGTEVGRNIDPYTWINYVMNDVAPKILKRDYLINEPVWAYQRTLGVVRSDAVFVGSLPGIRFKHYTNDSLPRGIVIPDGRFPNEAARVSELHGQNIQIVRGEAGLQGDAARHASEVQQEQIPRDTFFAVISNEGSLQDLQQVVLSTVQEMESSGWKME